MRTCSLSYKARFGSTKFDRGWDYKCMTRLTLLCAAHKLLVVVIHSKTNTTVLYTLNRTIVTLLHAGFHLSCLKVEAIWDRKEGFHQQVIRWPRHTWDKWLHMYKCTLWIFHWWTYRERTGSTLSGPTTFWPLGTDRCEGFQRHSITPYIHIRSTMCPSCYRGLAISSSSQDKVSWW